MLDSSGGDASVANNNRLLLSSSVNALETAMLVGDSHQLAHPVRLTSMCLLTCTCDRHELVVVPEGRHVVSYTSLNPYTYVSVEPKNSERPSDDTAGAPVI